MSVPRTQRFIPRTLAAGFSLFLAVLVLAAPLSAARAAPSPQDIEKQIDEVWNSLEPTIEKYNQVHGQLQANQAKAAELQKRIEPLQQQVDATMGSVSELAVRSYMNGPVSGLNAVLVTGSPTSLADQLASLDWLAAKQRQRIASVVEARDRYAADKKALDGLIALQASQDAELSAKKQTIETQLTQLQKLRQQAYGSGGGTGALKPVACPVEYAGGPGGNAAKVACGLIGKPYVWAAAGPGGYDCTGLTLAAWAGNGVKLRHFTQWQWADTTPISRADLRPGDLVFFFTDLHHVGLYVGGGWMVHAPTFGDQVRMAKIDSPGLPIAGYRRPK